MYSNNALDCCAGELGTTILEGKVEGKRSRGRPKATWLDNIKDWTGLSLHAAVQRAKDRHSSLEINCKVS